jgi:hypothetical protein
MTALPGYREIQRIAITQITDVNKCLSVTGGHLL